MSDLNETIGKARHKAEDAYKSARKGVKSAAHRVEDGAQNNPLALVAGGIAIGALIGALLPKTEREGELLGSVGKRLAEGATAAALAARDVGKEEIASLKPSSTAKDKAGSIAAHIFDAAKSAAIEAGQRK